MRRRWSSYARLCSGSSSRSATPPTRPPRAVPELPSCTATSATSSASPRRRAVSTSSQCRTRRWRATSASPTPTTSSGRWPCLDRSARSGGHGRDSSDPSSAATTTPILKSTAFIENNAEAQMTAREPKHLTVLKNCTHGAFLVRELGRLMIIPQGQRIDGSGSTYMCNLSRTGAARAFGEDGVLREDAAHLCLRAPQGHCCHLRLHLTFPTTTMTTTTSPPCPEHGVHVWFMTKSTHIEDRSEVQVLSPSSPLPVPPLPSRVPALTPTAPPPPPPRPPSPLWPQGHNSGAVAGLSGQPHGQRRLGPEVLMCCMGGGAGRGWRCWLGEESLLPKRTLSLGKTTLGRLERRQRDRGLGNAGAERTRPGTTRRSRFKIRQEYRCNFVHFSPGRNDSYTSYKLERI